MFTLYLWGLEFEIFKLYLYPKITHMGIKSTLVKPLAKYTAASIRKSARNAVAHQENIFKKLIKKGANTTFGRDHDFANIRTHADYMQRIPCLLYTSPSPRDLSTSRMPSSA